MNDKLDNAFRAAYKKNGTYVSRRSFFYKLSSAVFFACGCSLIPSAKILQAASSHPTKYCGMGGRECKSGCTIGSMGSLWWKCCGEDDSNGVTTWKLCTYKDRCSPTQPTTSELNACKGHIRQATQASWCGSAGAHYICTVVSCSGGFSSESDCESSASAPPDNDPECF